LAASSRNGLPAIDRPIFLIQVGSDEYVPWSWEAAFKYDNLGPAEKYLVTFQNRGHMMIYDSGVVAQMGHFAAASFVYTLQKRQDYRAYFSEVLYPRRKTWLGAFITTNELVATRSP
jgi:hypothetical protein